MFHDASALFAFLVWPCSSYLIHTGPLISLAQGHTT